MVITAAVERLQKLRGLEAAAERQYKHAKRAAAKFLAKQYVVVEKLLEEHSHVLRELRGEYLQKNIASAAGVEQSYVSYLENGRLASIGIDALLRLLQAYAQLEVYRGAKRSS